METKNQRLQRILRHFKAETGKTDFEMSEVAEFAISKGYPVPQPKKPRDLLAKEFAAAAREQTRVDPLTGKPYRAYQSYKQRVGGQQLSLWVDIDEASRAKMQLCTQLRRQQMVRDGYHLALDVEHWNNRNTEEEPLQLDLEFTEDVQWLVKDSAYQEDNEDEEGSEDENEED